MTREIEWIFGAPSIGYLESAYTYTPLHLIFFSDGKAYFKSYEGAGLNSPIRRDGAIFCLNATTGPSQCLSTQKP